MPADVIDRINTLSRQEAQHRDSLVFTNRQHHYISDDYENQSDETDITLHLPVNHAEGSACEGNDEDNDDTNANPELYNDDANDRIVTQMENLDKMEIHENDEVHETNPNS